MSHTEGRARIDRYIHEFTALRPVSGRRRGHNIGGVCKTESSDDYFRSSASGRILGGRVLRPETTRWVARQVAPLTGAPTLQSVVESRHIKQPDNAETKRNAATRAALMWEELLDTDNVQTVIVEQRFFYYRLATVLITYSL